MHSDWRRRREKSTEAERVSFRVRMEVKPSKGDHPLPPFLKIEGLVCASVWECGNNSPLLPYYYFVLTTKCVTHTCASERINEACKLPLAQGNTLLYSTIAITLLKMRTF